MNSSSSAAPIAAHAAHDVRREELRQKLNQEASAIYNPWFHLIFPSTIGLGFCVLALTMVHHLTWWDALMFPLSWIFLNAAEWFIHRDVLHHRVPAMRMLYQRHTLEHHQIFMTDDMAIRNRREFRLVLIPAYAIFVALFAALPLPIVLYLMGAKNAGLIFFAMAMAYVVSYEWLHLSYHLPTDTRIGSSRIIGLLRRHHAVHHDLKLMQRWNFNVTVPLWDWVRRTTYRAPQSDVSR